MKNIRPTRPGAEMVLDAAREQVARIIYRPSAEGGPPSDAEWEADPRAAAACRAAAAEIEAVYLRLLPHLIRAAATVREG